MHDELLEARAEETLFDSEKARLFDELLRQLRMDQFVVLVGRGTSVEPNELVALLQKTSAAESPD